MALVNQVIPNQGDTVTSKDYRDTLAGKGYNHYQRIGSIAGSISHGTIDYDVNGNIVRQ